MTAPMNRLHYLDSFRGVAAIFVVVFHLIYLASPPLIKESGPLLVPAGFGATGVYLFFVLSGFSLEMTMPRHSRTASPLVSYGFSRAFRILPLFYLVLVFMVAWDAFNGPYVSKRSVLLSIFCLFNLSPNHQEGIVWASWTIGVEVLFYLSFPLLHRLSTRTLAVLTIALTALFLLTARQIDHLGPGYSHWTVVGWASLFLIGILLFRTAPRLQSAGSKGLLGWLMVTIGGTALIGSALVFGHGENNWLRTVIALGYALLILGAGVCRPKVLDWKVLRFYGRISYSVYLLHPIVLNFMMPIVSVVRHRAPDTISYLVLCVIALALVTPLAWLTYRFVEAPSEGVGKALLQRLGQRPAKLLPA